MIVPPLLPLTPDERRALRARLRDGLPLAEAAGVLRCLLATVDALEAECAAAADLRRQRDQAWADCTAALERQKEAEEARAECDRLAAAAIRAVRADCTAALESLRERMCGMIRGWWFSAEEDVDLASLIDCLRKLPLEEPPA